MPTFETGVSRYIKGIATVENFFPVDLKGNPDLSCKHCRFYNHNYKCNLNGEITDYPERYLGGRCPLHFPDGTN